mgnify:CR=1 FL=1
MKIALIGNMNNANFSLLRYFTDLGHEAHLYLFENDGVDDVEHFNWKNDTMNEEKWSSLVFNTPLINSHIQIYADNYLKYISVFLLHKILKFFNLPGKYFFKPGIYKPGKYMDAAFDKYDFVIGSGVVPALFTFSEKRNLDLFYPYSTGIEYYFSPASTNNLYESSIFAPFIKKIVTKVSEKQAKGIKETNLILNAELSQTKIAFEKLNKSFLIKPIPMFYLEDSPGQSYPEKIDLIIKLIDDQEFSILMTSRQFWVPMGTDKDKWNRLQSKNNHWLIYAFKRFTIEFPNVKSKLFITEYGKDTEHTKELILKENLQDKVVWIPKLPRKWLVVLLKHINVSVGEFYHQKETIWGGTAIEAIACGVPFINSLKFKKDKFKKDFGYELPPILNANSIEDIQKHLTDLYKSKNTQKKISDELIHWYEENNGKKLAQEWLRLLKKSKIEK